MRWQDTLGMHMHGPTITAPMQNFTLEAQQQTQIPLLAWGQFLVLLLQSLVSRAFCLHSSNL